MRYVTYESVYTTFSLKDSSFSASDSIKEVDFITLLLFLTSIIIGYIFLNMSFNLVYKSATVFCVLLISIVCNVL